MPKLSSEITTESIKGAAGSLSQIISRLVIPLVCILASAGLLILLIVPGIRGIKELREEKGRKEQELQRYKEKSQKLLSLRSSESALDEKLSLVRNALPDEEKIPELMTEMQMISREVGAVITSLQYSGGRKEVEDASEVKLSMGADGNFSQIRDLLRTIENASRVVLVNQFSLSERKEASMSANFSLSSFFLPPPTEQNVDDPVTLDFGAPKFKEALGKIEELKVYEVKVEELEAGKENPFME